MSIRQIKDAKDLSTNELIYFKGHAQATYMSDGRTVEEAVNGISGGSGEDSDIFILDLFNVAGYPDVDDITNTGAIEFTVDSELMSQIDNAIQKSKLVIRVDYVVLYNLEIDAYNSSPRYLFINSHFEYGGNFVHLYMGFNPSELSGTFSISAVNTGSGSGGSGGTIDTSNLATKTELAQKQDIISDIDTIRTNAANYKGTVTGVKINGSTKEQLAPSGTIDIGNVATTVKIDNVSKTPSSGTVDLGYINKRYSGITSSSVTLTPNIYYRNTSTSLSSFSFTLGSVSNSNIINEYFIEFTTRSAGTTVSLPSGIKWMNGVTPTFEASTTYQISIVNNLGTWVKFK